MRGEYRHLHGKRYLDPGSPPLARGILPAALPIFGAIGITPACAGNTFSRGITVFIARDHPRLRGEYLFPPRIADCWMGSPPLARGILPPPPAQPLRTGITPACAGNTLKESLIYSIFPLSAAKFHLVSHILEMS